MPRRKVFRPAAWAVLLCCLAGCTGPAQPGPTPEPTPVAEVTATPTPTAEVTLDPTPTVTPVPLTWDPSIPVRSEELFSSGIDTWGTQHFSAYYEDEYGPYFDIDVTLPWTTAEGEGYAAINQRFEELMEEYKKEVWPAYPPEDRPPTVPPEILIDIHPYPTPAEVGRLVSFRFLENDYYGGVHGLCRAWVETYDVTTGERLAFNDFFSDPEEAASRIQAEIQRQVEADRETYGWLFYEGCINPGVISPFDRELVYPVEDGFEVFYQWYTLGGHAQGAPTFLIPREVLEGVSKPIGALPGPEDPEDPSILLQESGKFYGREGNLVYEYDISLPFFSVSRGPYVSISRYYQEWMEELTELMEESAQDTLLYAEEQDFPFSMGGYFLLHAEPTFCNGDGLLQICGTRESYGLGAAHPLHTAFSHTFDRFTGERIELPDLFPDWDKAKEVLWEAIEPQAREALAFPDISKEMLTDRVSLAKELLDQNPVFFLDTDGLTVYYNEYAIASYAEGAFDFFVPKELWEPLIYPEYLPILNAYS